MKSWHYRTLAYLCAASGGVVLSFGDALAAAMIAATGVVYMLEADGLFCKESDDGP